MRLTPSQQAEIGRRIRQRIHPDARIWLFGSRVDDARRGGDVDLYVESSVAPSLVAEGVCREELAETLNLHVDLIVHEPDSASPISVIARRDGVPL